MFKNKYNNKNSNEENDKVDQKYFPIFGIVIATIISILLMFGMIVDVEPDEVVIIKHLNGSLECHVDSGPKLQMLGTVTSYPRRGSIEFSHESTKKPIRFNDGGNGFVYGNVQYEMPLDCESLVSIHKNFSSKYGVEVNVIEKMVDNAIYFAGPLMSSTESSSERRAELVNIISDQAVNGIYQTKTQTVRIKDAVTGEEKDVKRVEIVYDSSGVAKRQQGSMLSEFNVKLLPIGVKDIKYEADVEDQIKTRQKAITSVETSIANARRAAQDAITAEEEGKARAAKAKWLQEEINAKEIAVAEKDKRVDELINQKNAHRLISIANANREAAEQDLKTADMNKQKLILEGQGEAEKRRLILAADGGLYAKLEAYREVELAKAKAIENAAPGAWSPQISMGQTNGSGSDVLLNLMTSKIAQDLGHAGK